MSPHMRNTLSHCRRLAGQRHQISVTLGVVEDSDGIRCCNVIAVGSSRDTEVCVLGSLDIITDMRVWELWVGNGLS